MEHTLSTERTLIAHTSMRKSVPFLLPVVSALLVAASFPPLGLGILGWFGLAPLLFSLRQKGPFAAAGLAFIFGLVFVVGIFGWAESVSEISLPNFLIWLILFSLYFFVFGLFYRLISRSIGSWILIGAPALWVVLEYVRSNLFFLAWPWNLLGHSQYRCLPVIQIADITGVYGLSFLIVMVNQFLSQVPDLFTARKGMPTNNSTVHALKINWSAHLLTVTAALVLTFSYGWYKLALPPSDKHLRVALVQGNILIRDNMPYADQVKHLRVYEQLTGEAAKAKPDLIVWPASSLPAPISASRVVRHSVRRLAHETGAYLLAGGAGYEKLKPKKKGYLPYSNSEFLIAPSGVFEEQYNKMRLVPFNEYLPLNGKINWPRWITTLKESFTPGEKYTLFEVNGVKFGTPICWENMFSDLFRRFVKKGANFMVSATSDAFLKRTAGPYQTLAMTAFRSVENRVAIARSATTGVSAFINPDGEIVERIEDRDGKDLFVSGFLVKDIPLSSKKTFYTVHGDMFAYVLIGINVLSIMFSIIVRRASSLR